MAGWRTCADWPLAAGSALAIFLTSAMTAAADWLIFVKTSFLSVASFSWAFLGMALNYDRATGASQAAGLEDLIYLSRCIPQFQ